MKKLLRGIVDFRRNVRPKVKETFAHLALGQRPDTLMVACSDSRVVPNLFASSDPGDLFVVRNVGNLIPPCDAHGRASTDKAEGAAIEFALTNLPVTDVVICGHSECGAMKALNLGRTHVDAPALRSWLRHGEDSVRRRAQYPTLDQGLADYDFLSQVNVLEQLQHVRTYPVVRERIARGDLRLHGWWFDIREANVYEYEESEGRFRLIDEEHAQELLRRAEAAER
jgi:carbonic anhydrase